MNRFLFDNNPKEQDTQPAVRICFTSNSIHYLATMDLPVNLDEWEWHEELIDGAYTYVITDRKFPESMRLQS